MRQHYGKPNKNGDRKPLDVVYVLDKHNKPLHPTTRGWKVKKLLDSGKAVPVSNNPFTIKLKYEVTGEVDPVYMGVDPGRENIGIAAVDRNGRVCFLGNVETSNKQVKKCMDSRKASRSARRQNERKKKQRTSLRIGKIIDEKHAVKCSTFRKKLVPVIATSYPRMKDGAIEQKAIRGTEAQFANRKRPEGWLTPSGRQLKQVTLHSVESVNGFLPVAGIALEYNSYDFQKLSNPNIKGKQYQQGPLFKCKNLKEFVHKRQDGKCLLCGGDIEHLHHVVLKSAGGSNNPDNLAGLCKSCHHLVHTDVKVEDALRQKMEGVAKQYQVGLLNSVMHSLGNDFSSYCTKKGIALYLITGKETYDTRKRLNLAKDHCIDAYAIALSMFPNIKTSAIPEGFPVFRWKRHKKKSASVTKKVGSRKYYFNGKLVATNRHKACAQKDVSLEEYRSEYISEHGEDAWKKHEGALVVESAERIYTVQKTKNKENHAPCGMIDAGGKLVFWHVGNTVMYEKGKGKKKREVFVVQKVRCSKQTLCYESKKVKNAEKNTKFCKKLRGGSVVQTGIAYRYGK